MTFSEIFSKINSKMKIVVPLIIPMMAFQNIMELLWLSPPYAYLGSLSNSITLLVNVIKTTKHEITIPIPSKMKGISRSNFHV